MNQKKIKFAIIGCGHIGRRHAEIIRDNADADLSALCDLRDAGQLTWIPERVPFFHSLEEMLERGPEIDVVIVGTPNGYHESHSLQVLRSGRHVVIEKPMALTKAGCERILHESLARQKSVFCVMQLRQSPVARWIKQIATNGTLGKIFMVQIDCFWNRDQHYYTPGGWHGTKTLDGGPLFTQFSHFIDLLFWVFGDMENIKSKFRNFNHPGIIEFEDAGMVQFDFANPDMGMGSVQYTTAVWDKNMESSISIIAENGAVKLSGQYIDQIEYCHIKNCTPPVFEKTSPLEQLSAVTANVINSLRGKTAISTNALEGMKVVEIIEKTYFNGKW